MGESTAMTMTNLLSNISEIFTTCIGFVSTVGNTITSSPLLLLMVVIPVIGIGVGLFRRLLNV